MRVKLLHAYNTRSDLPVVADPSFASLLSTGCDHPIQKNSGLIGAPLSKPKPHFSSSAANLESTMTYENAFLFCWSDVYWARARANVRPPLSADHPITHVHSLLFLLRSFGLFAVWRECNGNDPLSATLLERSGRDAPC